MDENKEKAFKYAELTLEEFCSHLDLALFYTKQINEFKLFWTKQNQTNPFQFPHVMATHKWHDSYDTYFEGGYGI